MTDSDFDYMEEFKSLIGIQDELNTIEDYERLRQHLLAWKKQQTDIVWERYSKANSALLHAALERGIYKRRDDGLFVPSTDEMEMVNDG
jgi:hypothetical protein